jgi:hypothetical protein
MNDRLTRLARVTAELVSSLDYRATRSKVDPTPDVK